VNLLVAHIVSLEVEGERERERERELLNLKTAQVVWVRLTLQRNLSRGPMKG